MVRPPGGDRGAPAQAGAGWSMPDGKYPILTAEDRRRLAFEGGGQIPPDAGGTP